MIEHVLDNPSQWVAYFGYGSLVNDQTRNADSFGFAARLKGYRRRWSIWKASAERKAFGFGGVAALSVYADAQSALDGLLIFDRKDHLPDVDKREAMYDRVPIRLDDLTSGHDVPKGVDCYIYVGQPAHTEESDPAFPMLQSYVDAVMQGFLHKFGEEGVSRFVEETDGWQTHLLLDRSAPFYPRHVTLSEEERGVVDHYTRLSGAPTVPMQPRAQD